MTANANRPVPKNAVADGRGGWVRSSTHGPVTQPVTGEEFPSVPDDLPIHQPAAPDAPIPGRHWYSGCDPDRPRVGPDGTCEGCGEAACPVCGHEVWDGKCGCP